GRSNPPSNCSKVDLPHPLGPTMATNSPSLMEKSTPRSALTCPSSNSRVRAFASRRDAIKSSAIAARREDLQGSASVKLRRSDNLYTGLVRLVFLAAIFQRVAAKRNEADRPVDDELHETVREAA